MRRRSSALACVCAALTAWPLASCAGARGPAAAIPSARGLAEPVEGERAAPEALAAEPAQPAPTGTEAAPGAAPVPATAAGAVDAAPEAGPPSEASLRRQLANDSDPTEVALELAARLCESERVGEALSVLDAALARTSSPLLRVARAGVLRDLGRRHLARSELQALRRERGAADLHPRLLFELAELEWLEGDAISAAATLREIGTVHAGDPWCAAHSREREALAAEVERGGVPSRMRVRDLLGNLRGAPQATERLAVLQQLWNAAGRTGDTKVAQRERERLLAIALGDDAAAVRAKAVQLAMPDPADAEAFVRAGLADEAPLVRQVTATRCNNMLGAGAQAVLFEHLAREQDPGVFLALHDALAAAAGVVDVVLSAGVANANGRAEVVARWRARVRP